MGSYKSSSVGQFVAAVLLSLAVLGGGVQSALADCGTPCFADNDDILSGKRDLLPVDDTLFLDADFDGNLNFLNWSITVFETSDLNWTAAKFLPLPGASQNSEVLPSNDVGRFFALENDVIVNLYQLDNTDWMLAVTDPSDSSNDWSATLAGVGPYNGDRGSTTALADFNRDGYDDLLLVDSATARVLTAKCTNDPGAACTGTSGNAISDGLVSGPAYQLTAAEEPQSLRLSPATGDFNGDGVLDVAWPTSGTTVVFVSVCPAANVQLFGTTCADALQIVPAPSNSVITMPSGDRLTVAAGNFDGSTPAANTGIVDDELVISAQSGGTTTLHAYFIDDQMMATEGPAPVSWATVSGFELYGRNWQTPVFLVAGPLDSASNQEQVVAGSTVVGQSGNNLFPTQSRLDVVSFTTDLSMTRSGLSVGLNIAGGGNVNPNYSGTIAIGRFDPPDANAAPDFDLQISWVLQIPEQSPVLRMYRIPDPSTSTLPVLVQSNPHEFLAWNIAAGDTQGRSLMLGEPTVVRVSHLQPDTVLGMPPGHIDYITPDGQAAAKVFNVSVAPDSFNTSYDYTDTSKTSSSRKMTTSYSVSTTEKFGEQLSFGDPAATGVSTELKQAATQTHSTSVTQQYSQYQTNTYSLEDGTSKAFGDQVSYTSRTMNIYTYPVIGQFICAAGFTEVTINSETKCCPNADVSNGSCSEPVKAVDPSPMNVQYSGVDNIIHYDPAPGSTLEMFQPPHEVGQALSYPGNFFQLQADISRLQLQTAANPPLWTQQSTDTTSVTWAGGSGSGTTTGTTSSHSFDASVSASGGLKVLGLSGSTMFDYSESESVSSLNSSTSSSDASLGITVNRGGREHWRRSDHQPGIPVQ